MQLQNSLPKKGILLFGVALGILTSLTVNKVLAGTNTIYACVHQGNGELRIIRQGQKCHRDESPLSWNIQGPPGPVGVGGFISNDLSNQTLHFSGYNNFNYRNFSNVNFTNANLETIEFNNADLSDSNFTSADMSGDFLGGARFTNANFTNTNMDAATGTPADITGATWSNTTCPDGTNSNNNGNTCAGHFL